MRGGTATYLPPALARDDKGFVKAGFPIELRELLRGSWALAEFGRPD